MADWNFIEDSEIDAGSPMNTSLFSRLARNPQAIAEGADGAPPVQIEALGDIAAGGVAQQVLLGTVGVSGAEYRIVRGFTCLQAGSMRLSYAYSAGTAWIHYLYVDGVEVLADTGSTVVDISVDHGSQVWITARASSTATGTFSAVTILTDDASPFFPVIPYF